MQRRLLPDRAPRRSPASRSPPAISPPSGGSLGGDWYDVFSLPGGRVAVAVGDVVGRGVEAAAVMAQLRTAVRAYAADGHPPATRPRPGQHADVAPRPAGHDHGGLRDPGPGERKRSSSSAPGIRPRWSSRRPAPRRTSSRSAGAPARGERVVHLPVADVPTCPRAPSCCSTPTVSWSAGASRSTSASSGSACSARGSMTSRPSARRSSSASSATSRATTSRSSPRASRR